MSTNVVCRSNWKILYRFIRYVNETCEDIIPLEEDHDKNYEVMNLCKYASLPDLIRQVENLDLVDVDSPLWEGFKFERV